MKLNKEKITRSALRILKRTKQYQDCRESGTDEQDNFQLQYVLLQGDIDSPTDVRAYAYSVDTETMLLFHPLDEDPDVRELPESVFNFDDALFSLLESGYSIIEISLDSHCAILSDALENDPEKEEGFLRYLDYCRKNNVLEEVLFENPHLAEEPGLREMLSPKYRRDRQNAKTEGAK